MPEDAKWPDPVEIRERLGSGRPVSFPDPPQGQLLQDDPRRSISVELIAALALKNGKIEQRVAIRNAVLSGNLELRYTEFQSDVKIERCHVEGSLDLSFSIFTKAAVLDDTKFAGTVNLNGVRANADFECSGAVFDGRLDFQDATVSRNLCAQGTIFSECNFEATSIGGQAIFCEDKATANFRGEAKLDLMEIGGGLELQEARFGSTASFISLTVKHYADFSSAKFLGEVWMDGLTVQGDAVFTSTQFKPANLIASKDPTPIRFPGIRIAGQAVFDNAHFDAAVRFDQAHFESEAFFEPVTFSEGVRFDGVTFVGPAKFTGSQFVPRSQSSIVTFQRAKAGSIEFKGARFSRGLISFQDADFETVYFIDTVQRKRPSTEAAQFPGKGKGQIDLRGFSYERLFGTWEEILNLLEPYDIQPYREMERAFRVMGKDRDADFIYLMQRRRVLRYQFGEPKLWLNALASLLYWTVARFGVRPWRLAVFSLVLLFVSVCIFHQPGAVIAAKESACISHTLGRTEALEVALNYFLPVPFPAGACWIASGETSFRFLGRTTSFLIWASFLKLMGWILVPLGVAALTGLLRHDPPK